MKSIETLIALDAGKNPVFVEVYASDSWLKKHEMKDERTAQAMVIGKAYNLLEIYRRVSERGSAPTRVTFTDKQPRLVKPLFPGMDFPAAVSTWCCICNDATPPECACVPC